MLLPFRRHPVTQLGWSLFTHPATVEAAVSAAKQSIPASNLGETPVRLGPWCSDLALRIFSTLNCVRARESHVMT
jgi:hypothetical protein